MNQVNFEQSVENLVRSSGFPLSASGTVSVEDLEDAVTHARRYGLRSLRVKLAIAVSNFVLERGDVE